MHLSFLCFLPPVPSGKVSRPSARSRRGILSSSSLVNEGKWEDSEPPCYPTICLCLSGSNTCSRKSSEGCNQPRHILSGGGDEFPNCSPFCLPWGPLLPFFLASLLLPRVFLKSPFHSFVSIQKTQNKSDHFLPDTQKG